MVIKVTLKTICRSNKQKRLQLCKNQEKLHRENCEPCKTRIINDLTMCRDCQTFKELSTIGNRLLEISNENKPFETKSKRRDNGAYQRDKLSLDKHFHRLYESLRTNKKVAEKIGVPLCHLNRWRREMNLAKKYKGAE
jgi:hypothetical protein